MTETSKEERERAFAEMRGEIRTDDPGAIGDFGDAGDLLYDALCDADRLAAIERQVLWRTEDMPEWAVLWAKSSGGRYCWWLSANTLSVSDKSPSGAPDYRPDEPGPIWLPILDHPEGS